MADDRKRAIALKAADARALLQKHLPYVLHVLTPAQLAQVQRVLDAEVVNPEVAKQANEVYRKSVTAQSGNLVLRDEKTVRSLLRRLEVLGFFYADRNRVPPRTHYRIQPPISGKDKPRLEAGEHSFPDQNNQRNNE